MKKKKSVMNQIISVFVLVLVISVLAGLTFLFVSEVKEQAEINGLETKTVTNEAGFVNITGYEFSVVDTDPTATSFTLTGMWNSTKTYAVSNATVNASGWVLGSATFWLNDTSTRLNYTYSSAADSTAYRAVNSTEDAGTTVVDYLPLIFLALIFGAILTLVLRIILPYINLGQRFNAF